MAAIFNRIGQLGLGLALAGGVINSALYNGRKCHPALVIVLAHSPSPSVLFQLTVASEL